jgi:hypothetical protein
LNEKFGFCISYIEIFLIRILWVMSVFRCPDEVSAVARFIISPTLLDPDGFRSSAASGGTQARCFLS